MQFKIITLTMAGENSTLKEFSQLPCGSDGDFCSNEEKGKRLRCCIIAMGYIVSLITLSRVHNERRIGRQSI